MDMHQACRDMTAGSHQTHMQTEIKMEHRPNMKPLHALTIANAACHDPELAAAFNRGTGDPS